MAYYVKKLQFCKSNNLQQKVTKLIDLFKKNDYDVLNLQGIHNLARQSKNFLNLRFLD